MGGLGSGRWGWTATRETTDAVLTLDINHLRRRGLFATAPGWMVSSPVRWSRGGQLMGAITVKHDGDHPDTLILEYRTRRQGGQWDPVRQHIALDRTACQYGGERPWFLCPGCGRRRAMLYGLNGRFRCRACHDLAYESTREQPGDRALRRADKVWARLDGDVSKGWAWRSLPTKPKGMRWATFHRLRHQLAEAEHDALAAWVADSEALIARLDRKYGPQG